MPLLALVALAATWGTHPATPVVVVVDLFLAGAVIAAVSHAETIAARVGEPFGSLVLAVAVTVIEVGLIVTLMVAGGDKTGTLARDTVFSAVMITCNGVVGLAILIAALRERLAVFNAEGSATAFATVITLATLSLVLPRFTTSTPGPEFSASQLAFASIASIALYGLFLLVQTVRHRSHFLPDGEEEGGGDHGPPPTRAEALRSLGLMV
ncbi:MAG: calcium:proton antiporter, partial [Syntrophothermus sp.]